ncbi:MAG: Zn-ribbon domain-containing OB-fold protein [Gammaproteobacteria bacterium]|nr:MAG: Zn-ribbon domain-containing OB-fold protein [Gammaproteobacteria bacterium]
MNQRGAAKALHKPIDPKLFTWPSSNPRLLGSRCNNCGTTSFPSQTSCPRCCSEDVTPCELATRGTLWSFTIQGFLPKSPPYAGEETAATFQPYGVGYVELPDQVRVVSRLKVSSPEELEIGMDMELVFEPFRVDEDGAEIISYAFRPVA